MLDLHVVTCVCYLPVKQNYCSTAALNDCGRDMIHMTSLLGRCSSLAVVRGTSMRRQELYTTPCGGRKLPEGVFTLSDCRPTHQRSTSDMPQDGFDHISARAAGDRHCLKLQSSQIRRLSGERDLIHQTQADPLRTPLTDISPRCAEVDNVASGMQTLEQAPLHVIRQAARNLNCG